jgi:hypothetical protein
LDLGRIGIQICFDLCFPESWERLAEQGVRIVFWPSAYDGGLPLQAYAWLHHYYIVSSVQSSKSKIVDPCGVILAETDQLKNIIYQDINTDFVVSHYDFNYGIPDQIVKKYPGRVEVRSHLDDAHFLVEPIDSSITVEQLQLEFGFESASTYRQRHLKAYEFIHRQQKPPVQNALHGERPQYSKTER